MRWGTALAGPIVALLRIALVRFIGTAALARPPLSLAVLFAVSVVVRGQVDLVGRAILAEALAHRVLRGE